MHVTLVSSRAPAPPHDGLTLVVDALLRNPPPDTDYRLVAFGRAGGGDLPRGLPATLGPGPSASVIPRPLRIVASLFGRLPAEVAAHSARMGRLLSSDLKRSDPDVIHVFGNALADLPSWLPHGPTVFSALDARHLGTEARAREAAGLRRVLLEREVARWRRTIADRFRRFDLITVVTGEDRDALLELDPALDVVVVPNGVDTVRFRAVPNVPERPGLLAFHGVMKYPPNVAAARLLTREILPRVQHHVPHAAVRLIGRDPSDEILAMADRPSVEVTGAVDDIAGALAPSQVYVAPVPVGTGLKNKLLEAMACGLPCVTTEVGAQGIHAIRGQEIIVMDDVERQVEAIVELLENRPLSERMGRAARRFVEREFGWERASERYGAAYRSVVGRT